MFAVAGDGTLTSDHHFLYNVNGTWNVNTVPHDGENNYTIDDIEVDQHTGYVFFMVSDDGPEAITRFFSTVDDGTTIDNMASVAEVCCMLAYNGDGVVYGLGQYNDYWVVNEVSPSGVVQRTNNQDPNYSQANPYFSIGARTGQNREAPSPTILIPAAAGEVCLLNTSDYSFTIATIGNQSGRLLFARQHKTPYGWQTYTGSLVGSDTTLYISNSGFASGGADGVVVIPGTVGLPIDIEYNNYGNLLLSIREGNNGTVWESHDLAATWSKIITHTDAGGVYLTYSSMSRQVLEALSDLGGSDTLASIQGITGRTDTATAGNNRPIEIKQHAGSVSIAHAAQAYNEGDTVSLSNDSLTVEQQQILLLQSTKLAIYPHQAAIGAVFRNLADQSRYYIKQTDGEHLPLGSAGGSANPESPALTTRRLPYGDREHSLNGNTIYMKTPASFTKTITKVKFLLTQDISGGSYQVAVYNSAGTTKLAETSLTVISGANEPKIIELALLAPLSININQLLWVAVYETSGSNTRIASGATAYPGTMARVASGAPGATVPTGTNTSTAICTEFL